VKTRIIAPALDEIVQAAIWLDDRRVGLGDEFWQAVEAVLKRIESNPQEFTKSEFGSSEIDLRFAVVRRFNYVVHFLLEADEVQVISIAHAARKPGYWLSRTKQ